MSASYQNKDIEVIGDELGPDSPIHGHIPQREVQGPDSPIYGHIPQRENLVPESSVYGLTPEHTNLEYERH